MVRGIGLNHARDLRDHSVEIARAKIRFALAQELAQWARNRGLQQFRVRGLAKVRAVLLWFVLAHNLIRTVTLRAQRENEVG